MGMYPDITSYDLEIAKRLPRESLSRYVMALAAIRRGLKVAFPTIIDDRAWQGTFRGVAPNFGSGRYVEISDDQKTFLFDGTRRTKTSPASANATVSKELTKRLLESRGVKTPIGTVVQNSAQIKEFLGKTGSHKFVTKPLVGSLGRGVQVGVSRSDLLNDDAFVASDTLLEEMIEGPEFRVYVVNGKVVEAFERFAPFVVGDGIQSISQLIDMRNEKRIDSPIAYDVISKTDASSFLRRKNIDLCFTPRYMEHISLSDKKFAASHELRNATSDLPDAVAKEAIKAIKACNIPNAGIDIVYQAAEDKGYVLEVNSRANIHLHTFLTLGRGQGLSVPNAILDYYFPRSRKSRRFPYFPCDFHAITDSLRTGKFSGVSPITPRSDWVVRRITIKGNHSYAENVVKQLRIMCVFVHMPEQSSDEHIIDAYFLPRGLEGYKKTAKASRDPLVSPEVDFQILGS